MHLFHDDFEKISFVVEEQVLVRKILHGLGFDLLEPIYDQFKNRLKEKGVSLDP